MGTLCVREPKMKHLVILSVLVVATYGGSRFSAEETSFLGRHDGYVPDLGIDCSPPTEEDCNGNTNYHPYPCNCHKYFQCVPSKGLEVTDCKPYFLIFNPLTEVCEYPETAPPGLCVDTETTPSGPTTGTTETTEATEPTTDPVTDPTTTPKDCWICPDCTCDETMGNGDEFFLPYPGDCHKYYECVHDPTDPDCEWSSRGPFDCGDWVFNPEQAACTWPDLVPDCP